MSNRASLFSVHLFQSKPSFYQEKGSQLKRDFIKIWRYFITAPCKSTEQVWPIITNAWLQRLFTGGQGSSVLLLEMNVGAVLKIWGLKTQSLRVHFSSFVLSFSFPVKHNILSKGQLFNRMSAYSIQHT